MLQLIAVALLIALPMSETQVTSASMKADVDRLVRAAEQLTGVWPTQPPPAIPEVALVACAASTQSQRHTASRSGSTVICPSGSVM
jgi:hypothetical protein